MSLRIAFAFSTALFALVFFQSSGLAQITNGSFESGTAGWSFSGVVGVGTGQGKTDGNNATNWNGGNAPGNGVVSQTFTTTPGQQYRLQFDYGNFGAATTQQLNVGLTGSGSLLNQNIAVAGAGSQTTWDRHNFVFTADSASTTLAFTDVTAAGGSGTNSSDGNLDNVSVVAHSPALSPGGAGTFGTINFIGGELSRAGSPNAAGLSPTALQNSTSAGGVASRGIDGNSNGNYSAAGSTTHTAGGVGDAWQVQLGTLSGQPNAPNHTYAISRVDIFNRSDCCQGRLTEFNINVVQGGSTANVTAGTVVDANTFDLGNPGNGGGGVSFQNNVQQNHDGIPGDQGLSVLLTANTVGDTVRIVQNSGFTLSLAEVQAFGLNTYNQGASDSLNIDIGTSGNNDFVNVQTTATLAGTLNVNSVGSLDAGGLWTVLTGTTVNATGLTFNAPAGVDMRVIAGGNGEVLQVGAGELEVTTSTNGTATNPPNATSLTFADTRIGTTSTGTISAENSALLGTINATFGAATGGNDDQFSGSGGPTALTPGASTNQVYSFTPDMHGALSSTATVSSEMGNVAVGLSGTAFGPEFQANLDPNGANTLLPDGSTIDFGTLDSVVGPKSTTFDLRITNNTPDPDNGTLDDLTLHTAIISGLDAGQFEIFGFTDGTVLSSGEFLDLMVEFSVDPQGLAGSKSALLTFETDQNAAFGADGLDFSFNLVGVQVPEPTSVVLWVLLGAALFGWRVCRKSAR